MPNHPLSTFLACALAVLTLANVAKARDPLADSAASKDPAAAAVAEKNEAEWDRLTNENWQKIQPEMTAWAKKGKIYVARAMQPEDLPQAEIPAFPGAQGGGMFTFGGRGGRVFVVSTLADSGPGSLREAIDSAGPRIVVFGVAGIIHLSRPLDIRAPYLTLDGHTAPGDGICIAGQTTEINTHDVVIRYMRFRRGITDIFNRDDALGGDPIGNVIIDHCSCSWGLDETLSLYRHMIEPISGDLKHRLKMPTFNLTVQWTIITEGLNTYHHAFGGTWGGVNSTFHHNLFACNVARNASIGMGYSFNFVNNVIFNYEHRTLDGGDDTSRVNCIANFYKPGPRTNDNAIKYRVALIQAWERHPDTTPRFGKWYVAGNHVEGYDDIDADNWNKGVQIATQHVTKENQDLSPQQLAEIESHIRVDQPFAMAPLTIQSANDAYTAVLKQGGAFLPRRDSVDERAVNQTRTGKVVYTEGQGVITDISQVGGYPEYKGEPMTYTQNDGIPDAWKLKYGLDIHDADLATKDCNGDGYTNIEKYLDGLDPAKKIDWKDLKNNVDPARAPAAN